MPDKAAHEDRSARVSMAEALKDVSLALQGVFIDVDLEDDILAEAGVLGECDAA